MTCLLPSLRGARRRAAAGILALAAFAAPVGATTVTITPAKDNTLYEDVDGALSNGAGAELFAGLTSISEKRRAVFRRCRQRPTRSHDQQRDDAGQCV